MSGLVFGDPIVDWDALGQVILYAFGSGVGVAICFSLAILGAIRFNEHRGAGRNSSAGGYAMVGVFGLAVTVGAVVIAIIVMTNKS